MKIKAYIIKFIILFIIFISLDFSIGKILNYYYFKQKHGEYYVLTKTINNPTHQSADILILGSSRARRHYNPEVISQTLNMSCYNAGYDAQSILFHKALLDIIEEKYKPEIIILDINNNELLYEEISYDQLSILLPYVQYYPELWNTLLLKSPFEKIKYLSKIYPYNSLLDKIVRGNMDSMHGENDINGFVPFYGSYNRDITEKSFPETTLDKNKIDAFNSFIDICKKKNIKLFVVYSPEYLKILNNSSSIEYIIDKCKQNDIDYITYQNNADFLKGELFREALHLNNVGADEFSLDLSLKLKEKIGENGE